MTSHKLLFFESNRIIITVEYKNTQSFVRSFVHTIAFNSHWHSSNCNNLNIKLLPKWNYTSTVNMLKYSYKCIIYYNIGWLENGQKNGQVMMTINFSCTAYSKMQSKRTHTGANESMKWVDMNSTNVVQTNKPTNSNNDKNNNNNKNNIVSEPKAAKTNIKNKTL